MQHALGDEYTILIRKPEGKRALVRPRHRLKNLNLGIEGGWVWTRFSWLRVGTGGRLL
jgi:hypothetical protein